MSRTYKDMRIKVRGTQRKKPDARRMARVLIELAQAQAEADAQAASEAHPQPTSNADQERQPKQDGRSRRAS